TAFNSSVMGSCLAIDTLLSVERYGADDSERNLTCDPDAPAWLPDRIALLRIRKPAAYDQALADQEKGKLEEFYGTRPNREARAWRQFNCVGCDLETLGLVRV